MPSPIFPSASHYDRRYLGKGNVRSALVLYALACGPSFIHQHDVDAYAAQHAADNSKPITTTFALVGLYLTVEKNYTGKQVQRAHMQLARKRKEWSRFSQPQNTGAFSVFDVMRESPGVHRDQAISQWCSSVWDAWAESHQEIAELVHTELGI